MKIKFQLETRVVVRQAGKPEKLLLTCELNDEEKSRAFESSLPANISERQKLQDAVLYTLKYGQCHLKYKRTGAWVFYNHDFFIEDDGSTIKVVFPRGNDAVFIVNDDLYSSRKFKYSE
jgi:hypothetical protein